MKRKMKLLCATICAFAISTGMGIATASFTPAHAAENFEMLEGASIRYASESGTNGLRFTATVPAAEYVEGATYGVLIAPEDYVAKNPLDYENVFGSNAVYDWAVRNENGEYVYTGTKTRIINIVYDELNANSEGNRVLNGSILNIKDGNLSRNFVGRAYVKNGDSYTLADYATVDGVSGAAHNTRSALEVAQRAYFSGSSFTAEQQETIDHYMGNSANYSAASLTAGDDYVLFVDKYATSYTTGEKLSSNLSLHAELADDSLPAGYPKAYRLNCDYTAAGDYKIFNNLDKDGYTRLKFYIKLEQDGNGNKTGGYSIPFRGRNDDKMYEWVPVEYVKKAGGSWSVYYEDTEITACPTDRVFGLDLNGFVCVTEVLGVKDARDEVYTVTYKNSDGEVIKTEAVRKGRAAAYSLGGAEDLGDGYTKNYIWTTEKGGTAEADLSAITANTTVYEGLIVKVEREKPTHALLTDVNEYIKPDDNGNITFKVKLTSGKTNVSVYTFAYENILTAYEVKAEDGWITFKSDVANNKIGFYKEDGTAIIENTGFSADVTTLRFSANDCDSVEVAAVLPAQVKITYYDVDGSVIAAKSVNKGSSVDLFVPASYTDSEGYTYEYNNVKWLVSEGGAEADLSAVTSDIAVYFGGEKLAIINHVKPKYVTAVSLNKYIKPDVNGNISFKVRLVGGGATVSVHNVDNTHADSERIILQSDWLSAGEWVIFKTDVANEKVYLCNASGTVLKEKDYPDLNVKTLLLCADDTPSADIAAQVFPEVTVTYLDSDGTLLSEETIIKGTSGAAFVPAGATDSEGYAYGYINVVWLVSEGGAEADLSSVTANTTVYYGGDKLIKIERERPTRALLTDVNKYIKPDKSGNILFKVKLTSGQTNVSVYNAAGENILTAEGVKAADGWITFKSDIANGKIGFYKEDGTGIVENNSFSADVTTLLFSANDCPSVEVAVQVVPEVTVTYLDTDGSVLSVETINKGDSAASFVPEARTDDEGYVHEYTSVRWQDSVGGREVDLSSVTANITVYFGGEKLVYKNHINDTTTEATKLKYKKVLGLNQYIAPDDDGNVTFMVRLHGNGAAFWVHQTDSYTDYCVGQWGETEKWYTVKTDAANKTVYIYDENGTKLGEKVFADFDINSITFCADDNPNTDIAVEVSQKKNNITTLLVEKTYEEGASQTSEDGRVYQYAVKEFVNLYRDMTGTTLEVVYVDGVNDKLINGKRFVLGSSFAKAEGVTCEDLYTDTGYAIKKQNGNVYLFGNTGYGTLNAVYAFLNEAFGLEFYSDEVYSVSRTGEFDYDTLTEKYFNPSIDYNWAHGPIEYRNRSENFVYQYRLGYVNYWQILQGSYHNAFDVLPAETYQSEHPNWYTTADKPEGGTFDTINLAYGLTAADNGEMAGTVAQYIYDQMISQVGTGILKEKFVFGLNDMWGWSSSSESAALKTKYGSYSAEYILFMKKVAQILDEKYTFGRNIHLVLMAYNASFTAPTKNLSDLTFYNNGEISMDVMFAPIESNLYRSATDTTKGWSENSEVGLSGNGKAYIYEQSNADFWAELPKWKALLNGGDLMCFYYSAHFDNYFAPLDSITNMDSKYAALADNGVKHIYNMGQSGDDVSTDWTALKLYLEKKFAENAYRTDLDELIEKFCNAYFGAAGATMHELYNAYAKAYKEASEYWANKKTVLRSYGDPMGCHLIRKYAFDKNAWGGNDTKLLALYAKIETALGQVEQNSAEYKRIQVEGITYRYLLAGVFENTSKGTIAEIAADAKNLGIDIFSEGSSYTVTEGASGDHYNNSNKIEDLA